MNRQISKFALTKVNVARDVSRRHYDGVLRSQQRQTFQQYVRQRS